MVPRREDVWGGERKAEKPGERRCPAPLWGAALWSHVLAVLLQLRACAERAQAGLVSKASSHPTSLGLQVQSHTVALLISLTKSCLVTGHRPSHHCQSFSS